MAKPAVAEKSGVPFTDAANSHVARSSVPSISVIDVSSGHGATRGQRDGWMARDLQAMLVQHYAGENAVKSPPKLGIIAALALVSWCLVAAAGFLVFAVI